MRENKARCLVCGAQIESRHTHDYVTCGCAQHTMVDGGSDYHKRGGAELCYVADYDHVTKKYMVAKDTEGVLVEDPEVLRKYLLLTVAEKREAWAIIDQIRKKLWKMEGDESTKAFAEELHSFVRDCLRS